MEDEDGSQAEAMVITPDQLREMIMDDMLALREQDRMLGEHREKVEAVLVVVAIFAMAIMGMLRIFDWLPVAGGLGTCGVVLRVIRL